MRWPIRNQILIPLLAIQSLVVLGMLMVATWWSLDRVQRDVRQRLVELTSTIETAAFPLTGPVLSQMRGLSGAEFVVLDNDGVLVESTLPEVSGQAVRFAFGDNAKQTQLNGRDYVLATATPRYSGDARRVLILYPTHLIAAARRDAIRGPLWLGAWTMLLSTIAMVAVSRRIGRRIHGIEQQVARVAAGDFQPIPIPRRNDELRDLSASVNRMGRDLERLTGEIRETERARLIKQLAGGIAHQLRNAITGARMAMQVHRRRCSSPQEESLDVALRQLTLTEEQIRGLVALIRDEQRARDPGVLQEVLREVISLLQPICDHRRIELRSLGDTEELKIGDRDQLRAALLNLGLNAIEATGAGGLVEFRVECRGHRAVIEVRDDGPGVPDELREKLFLPFQSSKADGMGLGLAIVQQAARDHRGQVRYIRESTMSCFELTVEGEAEAEAEGLRLMV